MKSKRQAISLFQVCRHCSGKRGEGARAASEGKQYVASKKMQFSLGPRLAPLTHLDFTAILDLAEGLQTEASPWYRLTVHGEYFTSFSMVLRNNIPGHQSCSKPPRETPLVSCLTVQGENLPASGFIQCQSARKGCMGDCVGSHCADPRGRHLA